MPFAPARELVSGPDVGGGYLLQLSRDREPPGFTYHLQEGGTDAARPPAASVEWLGFSRPARACMFGGTNCWERSFPAGLETASAVRNRYNRFRFVLGPLLEQRAGRTPVPFAAGLRALLERIAAPLTEERIAWAVQGAAADWLLHGGATPHGVELATTDEGCARLGVLLADSEIWPVAPVGVPGVAARYEGAAFLGTLVDGLLLRWSGPLAPPSAGGAGAASEWWNRTARASWDGHSVPVDPATPRPAKLPGAPGFS